MRNKKSASQAAQFVVDALAGIVVSAADRPPVPVTVTPLSAFTEKWKDAALDELFARAQQILPDDQEYDGFLSDLAEGKQPAICQSDPVLQRLERELDQCQIVKEKSEVYR